MSKPLEQLNLFEPDEAAKKLMAIRNYLKKEEEYLKAKRDADKAIAIKEKKKEEMWTAALWKDSNGEYLKKEDLDIYRKNK